MADKLTPREEFERQFGDVTPAGWQWLKEFVYRNSVKSGYTPDPYVFGQPPEWIQLCADNMAFYRREIGRSEEDPEFWDVVGRTLEKEIRILIWEELVRSRPTEKPKPLKVEPVEHDYIGDEFGIGVDTWVTRTLNKWREKRK